MKVTKQEGEQRLAEILKEGGNQTEVFSRKPSEATDVEQVIAQLEAIAIEKPWLQEDIGNYIRNAKEASVPLQGWIGFTEKMQADTGPAEETETATEDEQEIVAPIVPTPPAPPQSVVLEEEEESEEKKITRMAVEAILNQPVYPKTSPYIGKPDDTGWEMLELPSAYIFYDFQQAFARPLRVRELRKLSPVLRSGSVSTMLDVLASVISVDPRILTQEDFYYLLYWLRAKSFNKSPMVVKWTSRYGITDTTTINQTMLEETRLEAGKHGQIFRDASKEGVDWPRMYDLESSENVDFDVVEPGMNWLYQHSRYFRPLPNETIRQRMDRVEEMTNDKLEAARDVKMQLMHGVAEFVPVTLDKKKFDATKALATLEDRAASLIQLQDEMQDAELQKTIDELVEEIDDIKAKTEKGVEVLPKPERTRAIVNISAFFPGV